MNTTGRPKGYQIVYLAKGQREEHGVDMFVATDDELHELRRMTYAELGRRGLIDTEPDGLAEATEPPPTVEALTRALDAVVKARNEYEQRWGEIESLLMAAAVLARRPANEGHVSGLIHEALDLEYELTGSADVVGEALELTKDDAP